MEDKEKELEEASKEYNEMLKEGPIDENSEQEDVKEVETDNEGQEDSLEDNNDEKPNNKKRIIIMVVILVIVLLALILGIFLIKKNNKQKDDLAVAQVVKDRRDSIINKEEKTKEDIIKEKVEEKTKTEEYKKYEKLTDKEKEKIDAIPRKEEVPYQVIDEIKEDLNYNDEVKIPEKFNLKDKISLKVEDQDSYGLCWDFASMNTLETNIALKHKKDYDFSEIHVDYITSNLLYGYRELHDGGNFEIFEDYFKYTGTVLEKELKYNKDYTNEEYSKFKDMKPVVYATETVDYPAIYTIDKDDPNYNQKVKEYRNIIKTHIMNNGSLYGVISSSCIRDNNTCYTNEDEEDTWSDHAISIVGWDDNYSKDKFKSENGAKPKNNGAYIALNSWGSSFGDKGYFYISYEDVNIETMLSGVINTSLDKDSYVKLSTFKNKTIRSMVEEQANNEIITIDGVKYLSKLSLKHIDFYDGLAGKGLDNSALEDLNYFNLNYLDLSNNNITDISKLNLNNLYSLNLSDNNISNLGNLKSDKLTQLNLSNNPIKDLSGLNGLSELEYLDLNSMPNVDTSTIPKQVNSISLSESNITTFPEFDNLDELILSDNKNIDLSVLPKTINYLNLDNCGINDLSKLSVVDVRSLSLVDNNITDISKLKDYQFYNLDLSGNKITDYNQIKDLRVPTVEDDEESEIDGDDDYYYDDTVYSELILDNMGIKDISIINDIDFLIVSLENNEITDLSGYNGKQSILYLSGNKGIEDISSLSNIDYIILDDCDIKNIKIDDPKKFKTSLLSLNNNDISDLSFIKDMKNLEDISLTGNKNIKGSIESDSLITIRLDECNLKDITGMIKMPNMEFINLAKNGELIVKNAIKELDYKGEESRFVTITGVEVPYEEIEEINNLAKDSNIEVGDFKVIINTNSNEVDVSNYLGLEDALYDSSYYSIENGQYIDGKLVFDDISEDMTISTSISYFDNLYPSETIVRYKA